MEKHLLVKALLKDYIIFTRLFNGLCAAGLSTENLAFNLGNTIFKFMDLGVDEVADTRFSLFISLTEKINSFDAEDWREEVENVANEAFALLNLWAA